MVRSSDPGRVFTAAAIVLLLVAGACGGGKAHKSANAVTNATGPDASAPSATQGATGPAAGAKSTGAVSAGGTAGGGGGAAVNSGGAPTNPHPKISPTYRGDVGITKTSIKIGAIYPQSGSFAALFQQYPRIYQAAFNDVNDREHGVYGRKLELVTADEADSASQAQAGTRKLVTSAFGFGTALQELTEASVANAAHMPTLTILGSITPGALHGKYPYAFQMGTPPGYLEIRNGPSRIHQAFPKLVDRTVLVTTPDVYPDAAKAFTAAAKRHGVNVVHVEKLQLNQAQCLNAVSNVQSFHPKIVYVHSSSIEAGCFFRDARTAGFHPQWSGRLAQLTNTASGNATDGQVGITYIQTLNSPEGKRLLATYKKYYPNDQFTDIEPNLLAWAAAQMWIQWMKALGPEPTRAKFPGAVESHGPYPSGFLGPQSYSPGNHVGSEHTISGHVTGGNVVITDATWRKTYDGISDPPFFPFK